MRAFDIEAIRADFPILGRQVYGRPLVYLDNAATAQKPRRVVEAMDAAYLTSNGNIHRGAHRLADESTEAYEAARETVRRFIGAESREEIVFTSGATASLNLAARGLCGMLVGEGDNIIVGEMEHHSNLIPWQLAAQGTSVIDRDPHVGQRPAREQSREITSSQGVEIRVLPFTDDGLPRLDLLETLIDGRTRVLALTQCSNVLGTQPDIARAAEIARRHGVVVVVDGCQGVVHGSGNGHGEKGRWMDVNETGCDLYAFSGHKLYGPLGIGVLYGKKEILERMPPFLGGGNMVKTVSFAETTFAELPFRFEAGTANYIGAAGLATAISWLEEFDPRDIARHERELLAAAVAQLSEIEGLRIYGKPTAPIVSFNVEGVHSADLGALLDKQGIAIRTGTHCAQPLMAHYGVETMCRASFALYNTPDEVGMLAEGVRKAVNMLKK
jgi:cysteine desulfurase/selenocysteine lyase